MPDPHHRPDNFPSHISSYLSPLSPNRRATMSLSHPSTFHRLRPSKPPASHLHNHYTLLIHFPTPLFLPLRPITKISASSSSSTTTTSKYLPQSAIRRIADKLRSLGYVEDPPNTSASSNVSSPAEALTDNLQIGEIFIPNSKAIPNYRVGHTLDTSWSTPENPAPVPGSGNTIVKLNELIGEAKREKKESEKGRVKVPTLAELTLPVRELKRLITMGIRMKQKLNIGKAGVTEGVVNGVHERWRREEVVKLACDDVWKLNMKRTHDLLESKTGGMVVWRAGSKIILYRGPNYKFPYFKLKEDRDDSSSQTPIMEDGSLQSGDESNIPDEDATESTRLAESRVLAQSSLVKGVGSPNKVRFQMPGEKQMVEEADLLLDGLGPRFINWWGYDPLPVDADLLPAVVPGFRRPFRLLPYGVKAQLTNDEMTTLKRLGRPLPCHFALGRNRNLKGLAAAMLKLWEKCEIAKIAVKRGVQNTNSEMMAQELKRLTGGILLSRDKEYIVFYRGKDFLPSSVSLAIEERRRVRMQRDKQHPEAESAGIFPEDSNCEPTTSLLSRYNGGINELKKSIDEERKLKNSEAAFQRTKMKLSMALEKKDRAETLLAELEQREITQRTEIDKEGVTEEERYMLRKVGFKMKPFLLLGRRGVFDGTVENMHLHWKYRELVKIICGGRNIEEVHKVAQTLEAESGGILIAVERVRNGFAIIIYRGKNYQRPASLRPKTLLNKKEAMHRSIEAQRRESLKLHVLKLSKNVEVLQLALDKDGKKCDILSNRQLNADSEVEQHNHFKPVVGSHSFGTESVNSSVFHPADKLELTIEKDIEDKLETVAGNNAWRSDGESAEEGRVSSSKKPSRDESSKMPLAPLSNKERLILRKQALKMKRGPMLSVGKSNIVSGVAKAIMDHFKKYSLVIVNVKGRAKGTSVQEVIFELQQATGALLVSQEPSKVILYRGWGVDLRAGNSNSSKNDSFKEQGTQPSVSPELLAAMRLECDLSNNPK